MKTLFHLPWPRWREIAIGSQRLRLDLRSAHERRYYEQGRRAIPDLDTQIAERFLRAGDVVLDAGANIGYTALQYLRLGAATVHAFEPVPHLHRRLEQIASPRLQAIAAALAEAPACRSIALSRSHDQGHSLNPRFLEMFPRVYGGAPESCEIRVTSLDREDGLPAFDFWKIDVEGSEAELLRGARETLARDPLRPRVAQIETYPEQREELFAEASRSFSRVQRAVLERASGRLEILDVLREPDPERYIANPPVYLFFR